MALYFAELNTFFPNTWGSYLIIKKTIMKHRSIIIIVALVFICAPAWAQKKTSTKEVSKAEEMGYSRTNKYWGPGTFYAYAPGKPINKMADNSISHMRDLTGISREDCLIELTKQGFNELDQSKKRTWYKEVKGLVANSKYFYPADKSYILQTSFEDLYMSPVKENGEYAYATKSVTRLQLIPAEDSLKVIEAVWQYLRELKELNVVLGTFGSNFKNSDFKAYPIEIIGTGGWTGFQAGTWLLRSVDGKVQGMYENNEAILHRTIAMPEFHLGVLGHGQDFAYSLIVNLTKEGYLLRYDVIAITVSNLPPGVTWEMEYPKVVQEYKNGVKADKDNVDIFKKAPFPPVLHDLNTLLHIK